MATRWYHVASAVLAGRLELADQPWHLKDARVLFPDDAVLLLDQGCLEETLASPMIQQATAQYLVVNPGAVQGQRRERFPSADENRSRAEALYQESIAAGSTGEARVRLGWVLAQRGRIADAVPHLEAATTDPDETLRRTSRGDGASRRCRPVTTLLLPWTMSRWTPGRTPSSWPLSRNMRRRSRSPTAVQPRPISHWSFRSSEPWLG